MSEAPVDGNTKYERGLRIITVLSAIVVGGAMIVLALIFIGDNGAGFWNDTIRDHFAATIGLSSAIIIAFGIVVFLRQTEGAIEFEALGVKFHGAAGQVVLWCFCVIVLSLCGKLLWSSTGASTRVNSDDERGVILVQGTTRL